MTKSYNKNYKKNTTVLYCSPEISTISWDSWARFEVRLLTALGLIILSLARYCNRENCQQILYFFKRSLSLCRWMEKFVRAHFEAV